MQAGSPRKEQGALAAPPTPWSPVWVRSLPGGEAGGGVGKQKHFSSSALLNTAMAEMPSDLFHVSFGQLFDLKSLDLKES